MIRRAVTIRPEGFAAPPQRNDANCVVTTHRGFDAGAWGANRELDTTASRKHAGTLTMTCAESALIIEENSRERALRIAPILADTVSKDSQVRIVVCIRPSRSLRKEMRIIIKRRSAQYRIETAMCSEEDRPNAK